MTDARYEAASALAETIRAKANELTTAIYEAKRMGYAAKVRVTNGDAVDDGAFVGIGLIVKASISFDIGGAI